MSADLVDFSTWRSIEIQAHRDGWNAQRRGEDQSRCPYGEMNPAMRMAWMTGWTHGNDLDLAGRGPVEVVQHSNSPAYSAPGHLMKGNACS